MGKEKETITSQIFEAVDIFSGSPHLTMKKKRHLSTTLGGILTICLVTFILYQASLQVHGMLQHEDPSLVEVNELEEDPTKVTLNHKNNFFIAVTVFTNSSSTNLSKAAPFNFRTTFSRHSILENGTKIKKTYPVLWAPCNLTDFPEEIFGKSYSTLNLHFGYCTQGVNYTNDDGSCPAEIAKKHPSCITSDEFDLQGSYGKSEFDFIQSTLVVCDPADTTKPSSMICDTDVMDKFKNTNYEFDIYIANTVIDRRNYEAPNKTFIDNIYWTLNPMVYKVSNILVDKVTVQNVDDYFSASAHHNRTYFAAKTTTVREMATWRTTPSPTLLQWNLRRSIKNQVIVRTYPKVQEFLTDLGGFSKALMFIAAFIAIGYLRYRYQMTLANELYDFEIPDETSNQPPFPDKARFSTPGEYPISFDFSQSKMEFDALMSPKGMKSPKSFMSSPKSFFASPKSAGSVNDRAVIEFFAGLKKRKKLDMSEWTYFKTILLMAFCCKKNIQEKYALRGRNLAMKDLDIFRVIAKLNEVEKLKILLLNHNQRKGLDFIGKPVCRLENKKKISHRDSILAWRLSQAAASLVSKPIDETIVTQDNAQPSRKSVKLTAPDVFDSLSKYGKLYVAYKNLKDDKDSDPITQVYNRKLILLLNPSLVRVFRRAEQILGDDFDPRHFEETIKQILNGYSMDIFEP